MLEYTHITSRKWRSLVGCALGTALDVLGCSLGLASCLLALALGLVSCVLGLVAAAYTNLPSDSRCTLPEIAGTIRAQGFVL